MITNQEIEEMIISCIDAERGVIDISSFANFQFNRLISDYENSKWIKFDKNDKSTWPNTEKVLILTENRIVHWSYFDISINGNPNFLKIYSKLVTHWQPLPELPE